MARKKEIGNRRIDKRERERENPHESSLLGGHDQEQKDVHQDAGVDIGCSALVMNDELSAGALSCERREKEEWKG